MSVNEPQQISFGTGDPDDGEPTTFTLIKNGLVEIEITVEAHGGDFVTATAILDVADRNRLIEFLLKTLP